MKIKLIDPNKEFGNLPVVTDSRPLYRGKFSMKGVLSEQIFGPINDYSCQCGRYVGKEHVGHLCENCKVLVTSSNMRMTTFAQIKVNQHTTLIDPKMIVLIEAEVPSKFWKDNEIQNIIDGRMFFDPRTFDVENKTFKIISKSAYIGIKYDDTEDKLFCFTGPDRFRIHLWPFMMECFPKLKEFDEKYHDIIFPTCIPVPPPETRPVTLTKDKTLYLDPINIELNILINQIKAMNEASCIFQDAQAALQRKYEEYYTGLLKKFAGKQGFLRANILGKRVDYSGRAVIAVDDADLPLGYCDIPLKVAKQIYKPQVLDELARRCNLHPLEVLDDYDNPKYDDILFDILNEKFRETFIILNRQPTLHRLSMQSFKIRKIIKDKVIIIHPLNCNSFNADFDGDAMSLYLPQTIAIPDVRDKMWIAQNHRSPANRDIQLKFSQDMVLGLYNITSKKSKKTTYLGIDTKLNLVRLFEEVLSEEYRTPENFKLFNQVFTGKTIAKVIDIMEENMGEVDWVKFVDKLHQIGFANSYTSICLKDFWINDRENADLETIDNNATKIIKAGARGSWLQYGQIALKKGNITDVTGKVHPHEITAPMIDGLSRKDYFVSCFGGRKGLVDSAANTALSGYLTRKLIYLLNSVLDTEVSDCHTELENDRYFELYVRNDTVAQRLIGRWCTEVEWITRDNYPQIVDKTIHLASPITCTAKGICPKCYGKLYNVHHSKNIGIIAAQSLGERTTQLTLRTKHISGASENKLGALEEFLYIEDGKLKSKVAGSLKQEDDAYVFVFNDVEYPFDVECDTFELLVSLNEENYNFTENCSLANIVVKSNDIVSLVNELSKIMSNPPENDTPEDYLYRLLDIYGEGVIDCVHFELIISKMMRQLTNIYKPYRLSNDEEYANGYKMLGITKVIATSDDALAYERFKFFIYKFLKRDNHKDYNSDEKILSIFNSMMNFEFDETKPKLPW